MTGSLRLLAGGGGLPLGRDDVVPRLRPGDRPVVVDASLTPSQRRQLRRRAHSHGLGADALVALLVERQSLVELVGEESLERADTQAREPATSMSLAASELQSWQRVLMGSAPPPRDDLPEIHLPLRLAAALASEERADGVLALRDSGPALGNAPSIARGDSRS